MKSRSARNAMPKKIDLLPYAGLWVAVVRGRITGVGKTEQEARLASKHQRPKEDPTVIFVSDEHEKR